VHGWAPRRVVTVVAAGMDADSDDDIIASIVRKKRSSLQVKSGRKRNLSCAIDIYRLLYSR
jgi:hypothetical protein